MIKKIAIVDDHNLFRKGIIELISGFDNYEIITEAKNGKELLESLSKNKCPDIDIMDINMPHMNGIETTNYIRLNHQNIKVLALSMYNDDMSVISMLKAGASGYVLKDAEPEELYQALESISENGFYYSDTVGKLLLENIREEDKSFLKDVEKEFLKWVCTELTYKEIADKMNVSPRTVDGYRDMLFQKLDIKSRVGLVIFAIKQGIYKLE